MSSRLSALLVAVGAVAALNGCGDPTGTRPNLTNFALTLKVFALSGTPPTFPAAILIQEQGAVRLDAAFAFDVAFDIKSADSVVLYTPRALASELASPGRVGLQLSGQSFDEVKSAPTSNYVYDSTLVVPVNRGTVLVDVFDASCFSSFFGPNIRGKFAVDSVNVSTRAIYLHLLSNRNCGLKSLEPGLPKD